MVGDATCANDPERHEVGEALEGVKFRVAWAERHGQVLSIEWRWANDAEEKRALGGTNVGLTWDGVPGGMGSGQKGDFRRAQAKPVAAWRTPGLNKAARSYGLVTFQPCGQSVPQKPNDIPRIA